MQGYLLIFLTVTVEQFFGETAFDVCEGHMFQNSLIVAYKRPKPTLFVSTSMIEYLKKEVEADGKIEFVRNLKLNIAEEWNPIFKPFIVR